MRRISSGRQSGRVAMESATTSSGSIACKKQRLQPGDGAVGVRVLLKIGDVPGVSPLFAENEFRLLQLFRNGCAAGRGKLAASRAEHAATRAERSVPVRAGAARGERELIDLAAEAIF